MNTVQLTGSRACWTIGFSTWHAVVDLVNLLAYALLQRLFQLRISCYRGKWSRTTRGIGSAKRRAVDHFRPAMDRRNLRKRGKDSLAGLGFTCIFSMLKPILLALCLLGTSLLIFAARSPRPPGLGSLSTSQSPNGHGKTACQSPVSNVCCIWMTFVTLEQGHKVCQTARASRGSASRPSSVKMSWHRMG